MSKSRAVLAFSLLLSAAPLLAQTTPVPTAPAVPVGQPAPEEKKICRRNEGSTGSIMMQRKVCRTAAEWKAMSDNAAQSLRDRPIGVTGSTSPGPQ